MSQKILKGLEKAATTALKRDDVVTAKSIRLKMLRVIKSKQGDKNES